MTMYYFELDVLLWKSFFKQVVNKKKSACLGRNNIDSIINGNNFLSYFPHENPFSLERKQSEITFFLVKKNAGRTKKIGEKFQKKT